MCTTQELLGPIKQDSPQIWLSGAGQEEAGRVWFLKSPSCRSSMAQIFEGNSAGKSSAGPERCTSLVNVLPLPPPQSQDMTQASHNLISVPANWIRTFKAEDMQVSGGECQGHRNGHRLPCAAPLAPGRRRLDYPHFPLLPPPAPIQFESVLYLIVARGGPAYSNP